MLAMLLKVKWPCCFLQVSIKFVLCKNEPQKEEELRADCLLAEV